MKIFVHAADIIVDAGTGNRSLWNKISNFPFYYGGNGDVTVCTLGADGETPAPLDVYGVGGVGGHWQRGAEHNQWATPLGGWPYGGHDFTTFVWSGWLPGPLVEGLCYMDVSLYTGWQLPKAGFGQDVWLVGDDIRPVNKYDIGAPVNQFQIGVMPGT